MRSAAAAVILVSFLAGGLLAQSGGALAQYRRGEKLYEEGDLSGALRAFQQAYATDPRARRGGRVGMHFEDYDPAFQLGRLHARLGNFEEAERFLLEAAKSGYTERSGNAEEYRRWRAVVLRALSATRAQPPTALPAPVVPSPLPPGEGRGEGATSAPIAPSPTPILAAAPATRAPAATPTPAPAAIASVSPRAEPTLLPTEPPPPTLAPPFGPVTPGPAGRSLREARPSAAAGAELGEGGPLAHPRGGRAEEDAPSPASNLFLPLLLIAAAGAIALLLVRHARRRKRQRVGEGAVSFGRYAITGLLATGRASFVYEARDRGEAIALRLRRPDRPAGETERFVREAEALESARRPGTDLPVPKLLARGVRKTGRGPIEYLAMEKLAGRSLLSLSRRARRRLDPTLSVEILREIAQALRRVRAIGLTHEELAAEDVFLVEPVPTNAGNVIRLKIFGLTAVAADPARDALALEAIASELFRGRTDSWEEDEWVAEHVPAALRDALVRARESRGAPGSSFDDVERALKEITKPPRGAA